MERVIVFKAWTPFTLFTAAVIGELYYKNDKRVLLTNLSIDAKMEERIYKSGLFQEWYRFRENETSVHAIERQVDTFLKTYPSIDKFFTVFYGDRFGTVLAYRLKNQAKLCLFPDGSASIMLEKRLAMGFNEYHGDRTTYREVYAKYPIDISMFDESWLYDLDICQGDFSMSARKIDVSLLLNGNSHVLEKLNTLFDYDSTSLEDCNAVFLDNNLSTIHFMDFHGEVQILKCLFSYLAGKKIVVKPHPRQGNIFEAMKFVKYDNITIYEDPQIPWELIYLNLLAKKKDTEIILIVPILSTPIMSSIGLIRESDMVTILSLQKMYLPFFNDYLRRSIELNEDYYTDAINKRGNIKLFEPQNRAELLSACSNIFELGGSPDLRGIDERIDENSYQYFSRVGNLISKSQLCSVRSQQFYYTYFEFLYKWSEIVFFINKEVDLSNLIWWPSDSNIFTSFDELEIYLEEKGKRYLLCSLGQESDDKIHLDKNGGFSLSLAYQGFCEKLVFKARLKVAKDNLFVRLSRMYHEVKWKQEFWEDWYEIVNNNLLEKYIEKQPNLRIWVYGDGKIGKLIKRKLDSIGIEALFAARKEKTESDGEKINDVSKLYEQNSLPDLMIITTMKDYRAIYYKLPNDLQQKTVGLSEFTKGILRGGLSRNFLPE